MTSRPNTARASTRAVQPADSGKKKPKRQKAPRMIQSADGVADAMYLILWAQGNSKHNSAILQSRHAAIFQRPQLGYAERCAVVAGSATTATISSTGKSDLGCATVSSSASVNCASATTASIPPKADLVANVAQHEEFRCHRWQRQLSGIQRGCREHGCTGGRRASAQHAAQKQQAPGRGLSLEFILLIGLVFMCTFMWAFVGRLTTSR